MKWMLLILMLFLAACQSTPAPVIKGTFVETKQPTKTTIKVVTKTVPKPVVGQAKPWPEETVEKQKPKPLRQVMNQANRKATQRPKSGNYFNAIQTYNWMPGALYQVWGAPNHISVIEFGPNERYIGAFSGDTARWQFKRSTTGQGANARQILLVQPFEAGLHTTMVITTTRGTYHFELRSYQHSYLAAVRFRYPQLMNLASQKGKVSTQTVASTTSLAVPVDRLDNRYRLVVQKDKPDWMPTQIFNDGQRTYIEFPRNIAQKQRPALFLLTRYKKPQIVQYAIRGRFYVVPTVIKYGVLKLGHQKVGLEYRGGKK